jgi:endonuclease/exonuclease/phosphatase family metal-dependent hydrolase
MIAVPRRHCRLSLYLASISFGLALAISPALHAQLAGSQLKVMTWNMEWFPGGHPSASKSEAAYQMRKAQEAIEKLNPDILMVQEVADWDSFSKLVKVVPSLKVDILSNFPSRDGKQPSQNVGIASKLPANSAWYELWQNIGNYPPPRGFAFAALELPDRFILVYSVHFKSNRGNDDGQFESNTSMRAESSRQLLAHFTKMRELYGKTKPITAIIGGDFNTSLDNPTFAQESTLRDIQKAGFHWVFTDVPLVNRVTIPGDDIRGYLDATFDHVFLLGLGFPKGRGVKVQDVSDHMPAEVVIELPSLAAEPETAASDKPESPAGSAKAK